MNKRALSERDICTKFITPALMKAGWDLQAQIREEVNLTKGRVIVSGRIHRRGEAKRVDYLLHYKPNLPLAIIEAKDNNHTGFAARQYGQAKFQEWFSKKHCTTFGPAKHSTAISFRSA